MPNSEVDEWFANFEHPLKKEMIRIRQIILGADKRMGECIKWKSPTFTSNGNLATFNPRAKKHVSLMFHTGAQIPGNYQYLEGSGKSARVMSFANSRDITNKAPELKRIVKTWCQLRDSDKRP